MLEVTLEAIKTWGAEVARKRTSILRNRNLARKVETDLPPLLSLLNATRMQHRIFEKRRKFKKRRFEKSKKCR